MGGGGGGGAALKEDTDSCILLALIGGATGAVPPDRPKSASCGCDHDADVAAKLLNTGKL